MNRLPFPEQKQRNPSDKAQGISCRGNIFSQGLEYETPLAISTLKEALRKIFSLRGGIIIYIIAYKRSIVICPRLVFPFGFFYNNGKINLALHMHNKE